MTHRERVIKALNHEEPDRVPCDLGQGPATTINVDAYDRLVRLLGLEAEAADTEIDPYSKIVFPCEAVLQRFGIDFRGLNVPRPAEDLTEDSYKDEWGVMWRRPQGGHYIFQEGPFTEKEPTLAEVEAFAWPDPAAHGRTKGLREQALQLRQETDYAVVLKLPYGTVWDCQRIRGFGQFLEDLVANPVLAEALLEHALAVEIGIAELVLDEVGDQVDVVCFPDDLGFQDRPYMRPEVYRQRVKPYHRRLVDAIKSKTAAKVVLHSDGAIYPLIADFIDIGVDILNPVQVSSSGMDSQRLKAEFGADMSFWGGIDTNWALPSGTPEDVRNEVKKRVRELGSGGGYVLASVHNIQSDVPADNVVAMFDSVLEYGVYA
jgi:uroporphyrinogen decarboxylase